MLENMLKLSRLNVVIAPPILGYYGLENLALANKDSIESKCPQAKIDSNLESMQDFLIGKYFDMLDIKHDLYRRWSYDYL